MPIVHSEARCKCGRNALHCMRCGSTYVYARKASGGHYNDPETGEIKFAEGYRCRHCGFDFNTQMECTLLFYESPGNAAQREKKEKMQRMQAAQEAAVDALGPNATEQEKRLARIKASFQQVGLGALVKDTVINTAPTVPTVDADVPRASDEDNYKDTWGKD